MTVDSKSLRFAGYFVFAWVMIVMFGLTLEGNTNASRPMAMNAVGFRSARLGAPSATQVRSRNLQALFSSPLAKLAITAINSNTRCGDINVKAGADSMSSMDSETKEKVEKVAKKVELKAQDMAGVTAPMGFFDPLGFTADISEGKLLFYREVELKHGRVCMLAALGILVGENFHPLFGGNIDVPSYVAFQQTPLQTFWPAVVAAIAIPEIIYFAKFNSPDPMNGWWTMKKAGAGPGDIGFDPLGLQPTDPKELKEMQTKELNNGRLAMIAAAGMIGQELATGDKLF